ncbi:MAG: HAMP domain-containing sensor histidine kinase [Polyangiaceae bacterium]
MNDSSDTAPTRERLDALRAYAFFTPTRAASRMNLIYMVGFNALVLGVMAWGRATLVHFVVQIVFGIVPWVFLRSHKHGRAVMGTLGYFVSLANTGGLASPILAAGVPLVAGAALGAMHARHRKTLLVAFVTGLVATGALTMSPWLPLPAPLVGHDGQVGVPYIFLALVSVGSACLAAYRVGGRLSQVHERMVIELAERREEICAENEDRSRALEGIAARLAHEVKNPLSAIKGLSAHMARTAADPKVAERLALIESEATRLQSIVEGFLSFSRGLDDLKVSTVAPAAIGKEIALLLETRTQEHEQRIEVVGSEAVTVQADGRKIRQAMLNLVINALQASPPKACVTIESSAAADGEVTVKVVDRGEGMSETVLARLDKPYFTTRAGGSGLGVAVARGLVEQHGGTFTIESHVGRGTTVTFTLPREPRLSTKLVHLPNPAHAEPKKGA